MFLHLSVILSTGGVSVCGVSVQGGLCPGGLCPWVCPGGLCPWGLCPERSLLGGLCPGGSLSGSLCLGERGLCQRDPPPYSYVQAAFLLPSHNEVAKVMFLHLCVCPQGGLPQCMLGYHPLPGAGTTLPWSRHPPVAGTAQSRHPPEQAHLPPEQAPPWSMHPPPPPADGYCSGRYASY